MTLKPTLPLWLFIMCFGTGCASMHQVRFTVEPSALDYAQFRRVRLLPQADRAEIIRLDLAGSGYLEKTTGRSERVTNSFWQESDQPDWQDLRKDYVVLSQENTTAVFQQLVDMGLFDRKPQATEGETRQADLTILVAIRFRKGLITTGDPAYHRLFDELLEKFRR